MKKLYSVYTLLSFMLVAMHAGDNASATVRGLLFVATVGSVSAEGQREANRQELMKLVGEEKHRFTMHGGRDLDISRDTTTRVASCRISKGHGGPLNSHTRSKR